MAILRAFRWVALPVAGAAVAVAVVLLRGGDDSPSASAPTESATTSESCPVDPAICEFAKRVEREYREGDPATLISPKSKFYGDIGIVDAGTHAFRTAPLLPRVISIGCPIETGTEMCADAFSLVLTATPDDPAQERISRVLLGFQRDGADLPIITTNRLVGGIDIVVKGGDSGDCAMSGRPEDKPCQGTHFFAYTTGPATPRPTPSPTPTSVPMGPGTDPLAGIEPTELHATTQAPGIGYDTVAYYSTGCWGCGRPQIPNLYRTYRDSTGNLRTDDLFGPLLAKTGGYPHDVAADWERGHLLVLVCAAGYCGGEGEPSPDAALRLFRSRDGGVTFTEEPAAGLPLGSFLGDFAGDEVIVTVGERKGLEFTLRYFLFPSNRPLTPPAGIATAEPIADGKGGIAWRTYSPANGAFDSDGKLLVPSGGGKSLARLQLLPPGWLALWTDPAGRYYGIYDGRGALVKALRSTTATYIDIRGQLPSGLLYGNAELPEVYPNSAACKQSQHVYAVLVDWNTGEIHPLKDFEDCVEGRHIFVNAIIGRSVLRVATGGDCLNVRREPSTSSATLGCFADGVLLARRFDGPPPLVAGWLSVVTPALEAGWVAEEFVTR